MRRSEELFGATVEYKDKMGKVLKGKVIGSDPRPFGLKDGDYVVIVPQYGGLTVTVPAGEVSEIRATQSV